VQIDFLEAMHSMSSQEVGPEKTSMVVPTYVSELQVVATMVPPVPITEYQTSFPSTTLQLEETESSVAPFVRPIMATPNWSRIGSEHASFFGSIYSHL
jgi:hypothetical protein